jgi:hypothetical protein
VSTYPYIPPQATVDIIRRCGEGTILFAIYGAKHCPSCGEGGPSWLVVAASGSGPDWSVICGCCELSTRGPSLKHALEAWQERGGVKASLKRIRLREVRSALPDTCEDFLSGKLTIEEADAAHVAKASGPR